MQVKVIMSWDIKPGRSEEYFEFVVRDFAPSFQSVGWQMTEAWLTAYGDRPQIMVGALADSITHMERMLASPEWQALHEKLQQYITNYSEKIIRATPFFPLV
jgi:NIPSNAP